MEQEGMMYFVNPKDVMRLFKDYLEDYHGLISKETAIEELKDALDSAEIEWIDR
jgi:hypothetical protein